MINSFDDILTLENIELQRSALEAYMLQNAVVKVIVAFSGGKDSIAMFLHLLELGIPVSRIELWHHDVDGHGEDLFDWPVTPAYCTAFAQAFGVTMLFSYREGGIVRRLLRNNEPRGNVWYQTPDFQWHTIPSDPKAINTGGRWPGISSDLQSRWCSSEVKIDVMSTILSNDARLQGTANAPMEIVVCTGERHDESPKRSQYEELQVYKKGRFTQKRKVLTWRPIITKNEEYVWDLIKKYRIQPHPCYMLGWSRCSCQLCIFNHASYWATNFQISPEKVLRIRELELITSNYPVNKGKEHTLYHNRNIFDKCAEAEPILNLTAPETDFWLKQALQEYTMPVIMQPGTWVLPKGAFKKENCGAT